MPKLPYPGCKSSTPTHTRGGEPWTCRSCGKVACARCAKYFWRGLAGHAKPQGQGWVQVGERTGTCSKCLRDSALKA